MDPRIVPRDLPAEAAMTVYNWICEVEAAIWNHYADVLVPLIIQENALYAHLQNDQDTGDPYTDLTDDLPYEDSDHTADDSTRKSDL